MRRSNLIAAGICLMLAACGEDTPGYSDAVRDNFVTSCEKNAPRAYCECHFERTRHVVPYKEFLALEQDILAEREPSQHTIETFKIIARECAAEHLPQKG